VGKILITVQINMNLFKIKTCFALFLIYFQCVFCPINISIISAKSLDFIGLQRFPQGG